MNGVTLIDRSSYMEQILPFVGKNIIKILVGVRRSGKSTLLGQIQNHLIDDGVSESSIITMNLESACFANIADAESLQAYVAARIAKEGKTYAFFDEIQEVDRWEKALRSFMVDYDMDIYVTGSNARLLSSELATYITGRYIQIPVYPFSFEEYLRAKTQEGEGGDQHKVFQDYLELGGFPFQYDLDFQRDPSLKYLTDLYGTILLKDVVQRNAIRDASQLERILDYAIEQAGHTLSAKNISDYLKSERRSVSVDTVYSYLNAAEDACLLYKVQREDAVGKRLLRFNEKYYVVDQGLRRARGFSNVDAIDQMLENIVFMELLRRGYRVTVGKMGDREIDFIAERDGIREYYQVAYLLASEATVEREFSALEAISDNYPKYVLTLDEFPRNRNGIRGVNLIEWLLGDIE